MRFLFDFISPYAWLGWTQVRALAARHHRPVEFVPVLFAGLLDAWGHKGPAEIPAKRVYIFKDALRRAHDLGVPLVPPPSHPFNPLLALRVASLPMPDDVRERLIDGLFRSAWATGEGITDPAVVSRIATAAGLDGARALLDAAQDEAKTRVRVQTDAALALGVFGVPTVLVDGELFWGADAMPHLDRFLLGQDPIDPERMAKWSKIAPSSVRPGSKH